MSQASKVVNEPTQAHAPEMRWLSAVRVFGLVLYFVHLPFVVADLVVSVDGPWTTLLLLLGAVLGYGIADLVSGIVHWASDSFGQRSTPILGALFVAPFRDHHVDSTAITRESFTELHGTNCFFAAPLLMTVAYLVQPSSGDSLSVVLGATLCALAIGVLAAGQIHRWVHQDRPPRIIAALQRSGLVISARDHQVHHGGEHTSHYCIVSGWWNEPLKRWRIFGRLETFLRTRVGLVTTRDLD